MLEDFRHDHAGHTIARVDDYFKGPDPGYIDKRERVLDIIISDIAFDYLALGGWFGKHSTHSQVTDIA